MKNDEKTSQLMNFPVDHPEFPESLASQME